ncbi:nucleotidyltransferase domain-containing protein [Pseudonocardia sp. CA-107938]|uniref:nucleotidyltransferase domain-containing protein n=1 Tax=Pseudonocardia sp. CA-107938 TaxID=3240021 RepID=UPI003D8A2C8B
MNDERVREVLLAGVVGSTAYGLDRPGSDIDRLGVYAAPTVAFHGLHLPTGKAATIARHDPDVVLHEAGKFAALCLAGNPTVTERLWLDVWDERTPLGVQVVGLRHAFRSAARYRDAYLGYAGQQFKRLTAAGRFPDVPRSRIAKHARHLRRLITQGTHVWRTGEVVVRVVDPQAYLDFGEQVAADPSAAEPVLAQAEEVFRTEPTVLPAEPDVTAVEAWLLAVRRHYYEPG